MIQVLTMLFLLIVAHNLADYPLQNDFLAQAKNHHTALGKMYWKFCLPAHASIHAGFVLLITQSLWLALIEWALHAIIDYLKCEEKITFAQDQILHYICKLSYVSWVFCIPGVRTFSW